MRRFRNILVAVDSAGTLDAALQRAAALARENGARITAVLCLEEFGRGWPLDDLRRVIVDGLTERLERLADPVRDQGIAVSVRLLFGRAFLELILQVVRGQHDLLVKTAGGRGRVGATPFGSTDLHLLRKCPCPVWLIRDAAGPRPGGVLAAVDPDGEEDDHDRRGVASTIMELASSLAAVEGLPLHVVHVSAPPVDAALLATPGIRLSADDLLELGERLRLERQSRFEALIARFPGAGTTMYPRFLEGRPEDVVPRIAREADVDVVVLSTLSQGGIPGLFIGSTAESILAQVDCSVLAIKPASFVTPVIG